MLGRTSHRTRQLAGGLARVAAVLAAAVTVGGCVYGPREAFFDERAQVVMPREGDGHSRLALWPAPADLQARADAAGRTR